jgi:hypothetical protein
LKEKKLISLREIEGPSSPHHIQLESALKTRAGTFAHVSDVIGLARAVGGEVEPLGLGEDWSIRKEIFPGVYVHFTYYHADDELPGGIKVRFSGERAGLVAADILTAVSIACIGYMGNYLEQINSDESGTRRI